MSAAVKRMERYLDEAGRPEARVLEHADLRAVLALAKEAEELKRRVRLARAAIHRWPLTAWRVLDLRRPLPKGRK